MNDVLVYIYICALKSRRKIVNFTRMVEYDGTRTRLPDNHYGIGIMDHEQTKFDHVYRIGPEGFGHGTSVRGRTHF